MVRTVLHDGILFNSRSGELQPSFSVAMENGLITWVGPSVEFSSEEGDVVHQMAGKFILPGLIDCHVHISMFATPFYEREQMRTRSPQYGYSALLNAQKHLVAGFTTIRDCGAWNNWGPSLRKSLADHRFAGSRIVIANRPISQWGNQEAVGPDALIDEEKNYETLTGVEGVMHAVRERKRAGSDFIKTMATGGVMHGQESQLERSLWRDEEMKAIVNEAHRLGMHVAVHAHGLHGIKKAAKAAVDTIEHCSFVDEETADIMKQNNVYLVPTQTSAFMDKPDLMEMLPPEVQKKTIEVDTAMFTNHKMAFERGVKIACGTDAGVPGNPHGTSAREISSYVKQIQMTPAQAIQSATIVAAEAIKLDKAIGSLEVGKLADIVVADSNPLDDITVLEKLDQLAKVFKDGVLMAEYGKLVYQSF